MSVKVGDAVKIVSNYDFQPELANHVGVVVDDDGTDLWQFTVRLLGSGKLVRTLGFEDLVPFPGEPVPEPQVTLDSIADAAKERYHEGNGYVFFDEIVELLREAGYEF